MEQWEKEEQEIWERLQHTEDEKLKEIQKKINYIPCGDYLIPDFELEETDGEIGKYGRLRRRYLEENYPARVSGMQMRDELNSHLAEIERQCQERLEFLMEQMLTKHPAPDKATDGLAWAAHMKQIHDQAEEIIKKEIIFN